MSEKEKAVLFGLLLEILEETNSGQCSQKQRDLVVEAREIVLAARDNCR